MYVPDTLISGSVSRSRSISGFLLNTNSYGLRFAKLGELNYYKPTLLKARIVAISVLAVLDVWLILKTVTLFHAPLVVIDVLLLCLIS